MKKTNAKNLKNSFRYVLIVSVGLPEDFVESLEKVCVSVISLFFELVCCDTNGLL